MATTTLLILGASGDLTSRLLLPALVNSCSENPTVTSHCSEPGLTIRAPTHGATRSPHGSQNPEPVLRPPG